MAIDFELEEDRRWIAEIPELPGVMAYDATRADAESKVEAMARGFHVAEQVGPKMLARTAKQTGVTPQDLL